MYRSVRIEGSENFIDFDAGILLPDFGCGQSQEFREVDATGLILVQLCQDLIDEFVLSGEAEIDECLFQLCRIHDAAAILIEDFKGLLNFNDLFSREGHGDKIVGVECLRSRWGGFSLGWWGLSFLHKIFI